MKIKLVICFQSKSPSTLKHRVSGLKNTHCQKSASFENSQDKFSADLFKRKVYILVILNDKVLIVHQEILAFANIWLKLFVHRSADHHNSANYMKPLKCS